MNSIECLILRYGGKVIIACGWIGVVFVAFFDTLAGRVSHVVGPLEIVGYGFFAMVAIVERMLQDYLGK